MVVREVENYNEGSRSLIPVSMSTYCRFNELIKNLLFALSTNLVRYVDAVLISMV